MTMLKMFFVAMVVMAWGPDTSIGKTLRYWLVEVPARTLSRLTPFQITVGLIVLGWLIAAVLAAPELIAFFGIADLTAILDVAVIGMLLGTMVRLKFVLTQTVRLGRDIAARLVALSGKSRARYRSVRQHRLRRLPPPSDDAGWVFA